MRKIVLITTRDCYPFEKECLAGFEIVDGINVYRDCIRPLMILTDEEMAELNNKAQERGKDIMDLTQRRCIGKLFKDEKAKWTKGTVFEDFKKGGIPLLKKIINNDVFYVLPCTGTTDLDDDDSLLRQAYTSNCIDLVCGKENIHRTEIYAIVHSRDTGAVIGENKSGLVSKSEQSIGSPLEDIINVGHLYLFHHTAGHEVYDSIVLPCCSNNEGTVKADLIDELFPKNHSSWWDKLSQLNEDSIVY